MNQLPRLGSDGYGHLISARSGVSSKTISPVGSLPVEILRASQRLQSDLIVVPLALDLGNHSWTTKEIMDELVRKADCPVVGIPFQSEESVVSIRHPEDSIHLR